MSPPSPLNQDQQFLQFDRARLPSKISDLEQQFNSSSWLGKVVPPVPRTLPVLYAWWTYLPLSFFYKKQLEITSALEGAHHKIYSAIEKISDEEPLKNKLRSAYAVYLDTLGDDVRNGSPSAVKGIHNFLEYVQAETNYLHPPELDPETLQTQAEGIVGTLESYRKAVEQKVGRILSCCHQLEPNETARYEKPPSYKAELELLDKAVDELKNNHNFSVLKTSLENLEKEIAELIKNPDANQKEQSKKLRKAQKKLAKLNAPISKLRTLNAVISKLKKPLVVDVNELENLTKQIDEVKLEELKEAVNEAVTSQKNLLINAKDPQELHKLIDSSEAIKEECRTTYKEISMQLKSLEKVDPFILGFPPNLQEALKLATQILHSKIEPDLKD